MGRPTRSNDSGKLVLPSLVLSRFTTMLSGIVSGLLLIDISNTFNRALGSMGQLRTVSSLLAVLTALAMGVFSMKYSHKHLLLVGLVTIIVSSVGCFLAPNYRVMLAAFSISGVGSAVISPMSITLVAEHFSSDERVNAIGWITAGITLSFLVGAPIVGFLSSFGWRNGFIGYMFPVSLICLILAYVGIPKTSNGNSFNNESSILVGYRRVFSNRSAVSCLIGSALFVASYQAIIFYASSFYRTQFSISVNWVSYMIMGAGLFSSLGSRFSNSLTRRYGRKEVTVATSFLIGLIVIAYSNLGNIWFSLFFRFGGSFLAGVIVTSITSISLEQVPEHRGTMMSIFFAANNLGAAFGSGLGGVLLIYSNWGTMGLILGLLALASSIIIFYFTLDPTE